GVQDAGDGADDLVEQRGEGVEHRGQEGEDLLATDVDGGDGALAEGLRVPGGAVDSGFTTGELQVEEVEQGQVDQARLGRGDGLTGPGGLHRADRAGREEDAATGGLGGRVSSRGRRGALHLDAGGAGGDGVAQDAEVQGTGVRGRDEA